MSHLDKKTVDTSNPDDELQDLENDDTDRICRDACGHRTISDTITDVRAAIKHLPKRYFKNIAEGTNICIKGTRTGMKTLVGQIRRSEVARKKTIKASGRSHKTVFVIGIVLSMFAAAAVAFIITMSLMTVYGKK